ncbi:hypothetical protein HNY73_020173 [Argiope bruennichi]|uniref:Uncharacterized protein n=1 Tax=Argiope bruennichi TaxID=94029 RepID=A0A8T0EAF8_ARGBR|nr:hypothetical protein HNY73_020173 [Argiope bruennichi]
MPDNEEQSKRLFVDLQEMIIDDKKEEINPYENCFRRETYMMYINLVGMDLENHYRKERQNRVKFEVKKSEVVYGREKDPYR